MIFQTVVSLAVAATFVAAAPVAEKRATTTASAITLSQSLIRAVS